MIVAMVAVRMMQMPVDQIVDVVSVRHRLVPAPRTMNVPRLVSAALVTGRTRVRILRRNLDRVLIDMPVMHVMQMTVVKIVDMIAMLESRVPASGTVLMGVIGVMRQFAVGHRRLRIASRETNL